MCDRRLPCGCTEEDECSACSPWGPDRARLLPVLSARERNAMCHVAFLRHNPGWKSSSAGLNILEDGVHVTATMATFDWGTGAIVADPLDRRVDFLIDPDAAMGLAQRTALRDPHALAEDRRDWHAEMAADARDNYREDDE